MENKEKTLADLQIGDKVAIQAGVSESYHFFTIARIDKRGIITLDNGSRYRADGSPMEKGSKWNRPDPIEPVTDSIRQTIRRNRLASKLNSLNINDWKKMDVETLTAIAALVWKDE